MQVDINTTLKPSYFDSCVLFSHNDFSGFGNPDFIDYVKKHFDAVLNENSPDAVILKKKSNSVYSVPLSEGSGLPFSLIAVKKCVPRNVMMRLVQPFKKSKARRSFEASRHLIEHNLDTPQPLVYLERKKGRAVLESYFITEAIDPCLKINQYLYYHPDRKDDIHSLMQAVAEYITRMHDSGMRHRDCNLTNFLLSGDGDRHRLVLIDLNRCQVKKRLSAFSRVRDIGRLYWGECRPAFFNIYCDKNKGVARWQWFFGFYYWWRKKRRMIKGWLNL